MNTHGTSWYDIAKLSHDLIEIATRQPHSIHRVGSCVSILQESSMQTIRSITMLLALSIACIATTACVAVPVRGRVVYHDTGHWVPGHWNHGHWVRGHRR